MFCPRCTCVSSSTVRVCFVVLSSLLPQECRSSSCCYCVTRTLPAQTLLSCHFRKHKNKQTNTVNQMSCSSNSAGHIVIVKMTNLSTSLSIRGERKGKQNTNVSEVRIEFSVLKATPLSQLGQSQRQCGEIDSSQFCRFIMSPRLYYDLHYNSCQLCQQLLWTR